MTEAVVATFLVVFARAVALFSTMPLLGDRSTPGKVRLVAAIAVAAAIAPTRDPVAMDEVFALVPLELLAGLIAGFAGRLCLAGAETAGQLIGLGFGLGLAQSFDPSLGEQALVTRRMVLALAALAFLFAGGLEAAVRVVAVAPASMVSIGAGIGHILENSYQVLTAGIALAAPIMVAGLITNLGTAMASKASPAFNLFSVNLPALMIVGVLVLLTTAPALARQLGDLGREASAQMLLATGR